MFSLQCHRASRVSGLTKDSGSLLPPPSFVGTKTAQTQRTAPDHSHHDLKPIKAPRLCHLHLRAEPLYQVLVDDPVTRGKEGEDVRDEVALVAVEAICPVQNVSGEVLRTEAEVSGVSGVRSGRQAGGRGKRTISSAVQKLASAFL